MANSKKPTPNKYLDAALKFERKISSEMTKKYPLGSLDLYSYLLWRGRVDKVSKALKGIGAKKVDAHIHFDEKGMPDGVLASWDFAQLERQQAKTQTGPKIKANLCSPRMLERIFKV